MSDAPTRFVSYGGIRLDRAGRTWFAAVTAVAIKLTRIVWRILKDGRDFRPDGQPARA